jgi:hypothetical protein
MFTKAEIEKMPVEQQEAFAKIVLSKARHREQLIELVRGRDWRSRYLPTVFIWMPCVALLAMVTAGIFNSHQLTYVMYVFYGLVFLGMLIQSLNTRSNRRMDALLELLDLDHKNQDASSNSKDEKIN